MQSSPIHHITATNQISYILYSNDLQTNENKAAIIISIWIAFVAIIIVSLVTILLNHILNNKKLSYEYDQEIDNFEKIFRNHEHLHK